MILPDKYLIPSQSLIGIGAFILDILKDKEMTLDELWDKFNKKYGNKKIIKTMPSMMRFIYSLEILYILNYIDYNDKGEIYNENKKNKNI